MRDQAELYTYIGWEFLLLLLLTLMLIHSIILLHHSDQYRYHRKVLYLSILVPVADILHFCLGHTPPAPYSKAAVQMTGFLFYCMYCIFLLYVLRILFIIHQELKSAFSYSYAVFFTVISCLFLFLGIPAQAAFPDVPVLSALTTCFSFILCLFTDRNLISRDPLTRLNNRSEMARYMKNRLRQPQRKSPLYLVLLDLDEFKTINDTYGHTAGDQVLILFADILRKFSTNFDGSAFLSRYGGDEFLIVLESDEDTGIDKFLMALSSQLQEAIRSSCQIDGLTFSSGYARLDPEVQDITLEDLIRQADRQMYQQKNHTM